MYRTEKDMYPDIIKWLEKDLNQKFKNNSNRVTVLDTHDSDLSNFLMDLGYQKVIPEFATYQIRQDITGFIEYPDRVDMVFVECKNEPLNIMHLSQLIGYSCVALPIYSLLLSPAGMGATLGKLLQAFNRKDILYYRSGKRIQVIKWDYKKQDIDYINSVL